MGLHVRSKLLARQLWHMALADLLAYALLAWSSVRHYFIIDIDEASCGPALCYRIGIITAASVEVHIAVCIFAKTSRRNGMLLCLSRWLLAVWPLGFVVGGASVAVTFIQS